MLAVLIVAYFGVGCLTALIVSARQPASLKRLLWSSALMVLGPAPALAFLVALICAPRAQRLIASSIHDG